MEPTQPTVPVASINTESDGPAGPSPVINMPQHGAGRRKYFLIGIIAFIILLIVGVVVVVFFFGPQKKSTPQPKPVIEEPTPVIKKFKEVVLLKKGVVTPVPKTNVTLVYEDGEIQQPNCADCIATSQIKAQQGEEEKILDYSCGGIAGECTGFLEAFGYKFEITQNIDEQTLQIEVTESEE